MVVHVPHVWSTIGLFRKKIPDLTTFSMQPNAFNTSKYLIYSIFAPRVLTTDLTYFEDCIFFLKRYTSVFVKSCLSSILKQAVYKYAIKLLLPISPETHGNYVRCCAQKKWNRYFPKKNQIWRHFRCNQMPSTNRNTGLTPYVRPVFWATI